MRQYFKEAVLKGIAGLAMAAAMASGCGVVAMADDAPVIDMGTFYNTYSPEPTSADYEVAGMFVRLDGKDIEEGDFTFDVKEQKDIGMDEALDGGFAGTVTNKADGSVSFKPGGFSEAGTHYYAVTMRGRESETGAYTIDPHTAYVTVTVEDVDGQLTPSVSVTQGEFIVSYSENTDEWMDESWDYEIKTVDGSKYVALNEFKGTDETIVIPGEAEVGGRAYPVIIESVLDERTGRYRNAINSSSGVKSVSFQTKDGRNVTVGGSGKATDLFRGMESLETIDFGSGITVDFSDASGMFEGCGSLKSIDLTYILMPTEVEDTSRMFEGCDSLTEINVNSSFKMGEKHDDMFKASTETLLRVKGTPSEEFMESAFPLFKSWNRYLGEVEATADVSLSGKTLDADMFTYRLYSGEEKDENLVATAKNAADGSIDFGKVRVYDTTSPLELRAVQGAVEGMSPTKDRLSVSKRIILKTDGSLAVDGSV